MERFVKGDIVVVNFPFSDLTETKKRPALILSPISGGEYLLCQITGNSFEKSEEIPLKNKDLMAGKLKKDSFIRFTKIFTSNLQLIEYKMDKLNMTKLNEIIEKIHLFLKNN